MPVKEQLQVFEAPTLHRKQRAGYYGWAEPGFGVLANTLTHRDILKKISDGKIGDEKLSVTLKRIIDFCDAGFRQ